MVYFNELSAKGSVDEKDVREVASNLINCVQWLRQHNVDGIFADKRLGLYPVTSRRTMFHLFDDKNVFGDEEAAILIESFFEKEDFQEDLENHDIVEAECNGLESKGLAAASKAVNDTLTISLSHAGYDKSVYSLTIKKLDCNGDYSEDETDARNASSTNQLEEYSELFPLPEIEYPQRGKILYDERETRFPHLVFSESALKYIKRNNYAPEVVQIAMKLHDIERVASNLDGRPLQPDFFHFLSSPESETRDDNASLDITFPDGVVRHCGWHLRFTPGSGRIHFTSDEGDGNTIFVGYIGMKIDRD